MTDSSSPSLDERLSTRITEQEHKIAELQTAMEHLIETNSELEKRLARIERAIDDHASAHNAQIASTATPFKWDFRRWW